jgi:dTDP-4-dehydrorhamnose reductase
MRIAVTGYNGLLGRALLHQLPENHTVFPFSINGRKIDITNQEEIMLGLKEINPDIIINCAAYTDVDGAEHKIQESSLVNSIGVYILRKCFRGKIVQISTDYIFDGLSGPYKEDDIPNGKGIYGLTKLTGEKQVYDSDLIIRTTVLYGHGKQNFVSSVVEKLNNGESVELPENLIGTPTYTPHLAEAIYRAIELNLCGVLNIVGSSLLSRYEMGKIIAKKLKVSPAFVSPVTIDCNTHRPLKAGLITDKAKELSIPIYTFNQGLNEYLKREGSV